MSSRWRSNRFDQEMDEPLGPLANLIDLMLVFACGLIAALVAQSPSLAEHFNSKRQVSEGRELPQIPKGMNGEAGAGYESVGQVYRDPQTGKLILIGD